MAVYLPAVRQPLRSVDVFMLVPTWRFFAPTPGQRDINLLYQDRYDDGATALWTEIQPIRRRPWFAFAWNPDRRANKALFDIVQELSILLDAGEQVQEFTVPYLSLLSHVSCQPRTTSPVATRFLLMDSSGNARQPDPKPLFVSRFHAL
ncbi:hypothetical protein OG625_37250 [Streptomyces sp. NBC_01351]|uniref:hypothetical protein n=1 Tax=Streptomyces sp. NBC_01351 TaxID=2903833 RepID=UPI002E34BAAA|nr:hypothetical protein [Streptomyces sp. NBC_01351]